MKQKLKTAGVRHREVRIGAGQITSERQRRGSERNGPDSIWQHCTLGPSKWNICWFHNHLRCFEVTQRRWFRRV